MKIIACSDFQLGAGSGYGTAEHPRLADQEAGLQVIAEAANEWADLVLFGGDAFQHRRPSVPELLAYRAWRDSLQVPLVQLAGNHDVTGPGQPAALEVFGEAGLDVHVRPAVEAHEGAVVAYLPWAHPGHLRAKAGTPEAAEHADVLMRAAADLYAEAERRARRRGVPTVLVVHYALAGISLPGGLTTDDLVGEPVLDPHELLWGGDEGEAWDWVLAGHVHVPRHHEEHGHHVISLGSPYVCDFGEAEVPHGYWRIDTEAGTAEHHEVPGRPFLTIDVDHAASGTVSWGDVRDAVVRVRIAATPEGAARVNPPGIRHELLALGASQVHTIEVRVEAEARARAEGLAEGTAPAAALDAWLQAHDISGELADSLRRQLAWRLEGLSTG